MADHAIFGQAKLLNHPTALAHWQRGEPGSLVTAELDLTNRCNNLCPGCAGGRAVNAATLDKAEVQDYVQQLWDAGAKAVIFTGGGDPLVHRDAVDLMAFAKTLGLDVGLITNGLALTAKKSHRLVQICTWIRVSLDAGGPAMYKLTHGVDCFVSILDRVGELVAAKKATGSTCTIGLGYLTGPATLSGMETFLQHATALGVDYAQFRPFHGDLTDIRPAFEALQKRYPVATASLQKYAHFADADKRPYGECHGRHFTTVIGADANVYVCCHMRGNPKYALGNLREHTFAEIWARRHTVRIDFQDCPLFCRLDECNRLLNELIKPKTHLNFL